MVSRYFQLAGIAHDSFRIYFHDFHDISDGKIILVLIALERIKDAVSIGESTRLVTFFSNIPKAPSYTFFSV